MRIHVNFSLEIPPEKLELLRAFTESETNGGAATFVRGEAEEQIMGYLSDNGIPSRVLQREGKRVNEPYPF